jgi:hypothetical protein
MPYNPAANPYTINPKELPANQAAAAAVPAWNTIDPATGAVYSPPRWCMSPYYLPNWSLGGAQATSPVATASVTWPDAQIADRDVNANNALNAEKTRLTNASTANTNAINAINALTGGAAGIASLTPNTGPAAGGTAVVIQGSGFTGATAVTFGGTTATSIVVVNDGEITCNTPAKSAGAYNVVVTAPGGAGTLTGGYTYF